MRPDYTFYLGHHSTIHTETALYAVRNGQCPPHQGASRPPGFPVRGDAPGAGRTRDASPPARMPERNHLPFFSCELP